MNSTALKDKDFDLVSVVYHASQGCETTRQYAEDAKSQGDEDAARFFQDVHGQYEGLVAKGKELLKRRL